MDDTSVSAEAHLSGSTEAGGDANRLWCELFHRTATHAPRPRRG
jgi:hypothetical protein